MLEVLPEEFRERLRDGHWMRANGDPDRASGVVDVDEVGAERGHPDQGLGIEEEQYSGDSVGQGFVGAPVSSSLSQARRCSCGIAGRP